MTLPTRLPTIPDSPLSRWDERWKVVALTTLAIAASVITTLPKAIIVFGLAVMLLAVGRVSIRQTIATAAMLMIGLLPLAVAMPILGSTTWDISVVLVLRGLAVGLILFAAVAKTRPDRLFAALARLGIPALLIQLVQLAFRYSFLLTSEARRVRVAMIARGFRFLANPRTVMVTGQMVGGTIVRSQQRAETIRRAMAARGFQGRWPVSQPFRTRWPDVLAWIVITTLAAGIAIG